MSSSSTRNPHGDTLANRRNPQMNRFILHMPASMPGVRCYVDSSTPPGHLQLTTRMAGLGIFFVNTQVQPVQTIYIKARMSGAHSVLMAEAAALAVAALINQSLSFTNTTFLSDCQQLVEFLNQPDLTHPPDWRMKCFTQIFHNSTLHQQARIFKIDRRQNTTADSLARQAFSDFHLLSEPTCSYMHQQQQCPLMAALNSVLLQDVLILSASCC